MENVSEIATHFNFTQTRKSKQYLISFFNQKTSNKNETLYVQQKLKLFLENLEIVEHYRINEIKINGIQKFLDEIDVSHYNVISSLKYREYSRKLMLIFTY